VVQQRDRAYRRSGRAVYLQRQSEEAEALPAQALETDEALDDRDLAIRMEQHYLSRAIRIAKVVADAPFEVRVIDADAFHVALDEPFARFLRQAASADARVRA